MITEEYRLERLLNDRCENPDLYGSEALAFIGDGVFDLLVRERLVCEGNCPAKKLHSRAVERVRCEAQAMDAEKIMDILTEKELGVLKRGRNHYTSRVPKNASVAQYHLATGLECLFGYLYLCGQIERIRELFEIICSD